MSAELSGPATKTFLPRITLKGNSYQRGAQYGRRFKAHLGKFYDWFVRKEPREVMNPEYRSVLEKMEADTAVHFPQLLEKIRGWSDGSGLPYDKCRLLAFHNEVLNILSPGCSNILATRKGQGSWLGRNCDLYEAERSWQVQITSRCDDCVSHFGLGYLGLPLSVGVNAAGLVVGGASMPCSAPRSLEGLPNLASFLLWTQTSVQNSCRQVRKLGHLGKGVHIPLLDAAGEGVVAALGGGKAAILRPGKQGFLVATNHDLAGKFKSPAALDPKYLENSHARYDRLTEILQDTAPQDRTPALARRALADTAGNIPVCQHVPGGFHTIYSWVIQPRKSRSRVWLRWGYPCKKRYATHLLTFEQEWA